MSLGYLCIQLYLYACMCLKCWTLDCKLYVRIYLYKIHYAILSIYSRVMFSFPSMREPCALSYLSTIEKLHLLKYSNKGWKDHGGNQATKFLIYGLEIEGKG